MITVAEAQLSNMKGANADWKAQNIEAPNELAKQLAWQILTVADVLGFVPQYVAASADGGVAICFSTGEVYADVECFNTGEVWALIAKPGSEPMSWAVNTATDNDVAAALRNINSSVLVHA